HFPVSQGDVSQFGFFHAYQRGGDVRDSAGGHAKIVRRKALLKKRFVFQFETVPGPFLFGDDVSFGRRGGSLGVCRFIGIDVCVGGRVFVARGRRRASGRQNEQRHQCENFFHEQSP